MTDVPSSGAPLLRTVDGRGVATLTFNRPAKSNSYNAALLDALRDQVARLGADPGVRIIVLGGAGETLAQALAYSNIVFAGAIVVWLANTLSSVLRGTGKHFSAGAEVGGEHAAANGKPAVSIPELCLALDTVPATA